MVLIVTLLNLITRPVLIDNKRNNDSVCPLSIFLGGGVTCPKKQVAIGVVEVTSARFGVAVSCLFL